MDLIITEKQVNEIVSYLPEHKEMINTINKNLPEIHRACSLFCKTQSQFMDNLLTVSHPTPLRNARQILAEITRAKEALQEAHYNNKKKQIEIKILQRDYEKEIDELKKEMLQVEAEEKQSQLETTKGYMSGAIRKITNHIEQYNAILEAHGKKEFNEADFEAEEERYHIMKAFDQGLTAARARQGVIDEGNHIYLNQIGVNGSLAQIEILRFLTKENELMSKGETPSYEMVLEFLNSMAEKFKGCSSKLCSHKGMNTITEKALLKEGDKRLFEDNNRT